jgi:predicted nucleic acid-binding Zn ribbon protein
METCQFCGKANPVDRALCHACNEPIVRLTDIEKRHQKEIMVAEFIFLSVIILGLSTGFTVLFFKIHR